MVVIAAGRNESSLRAVALRQVEAQNPAIEGQGAVQIRNLQVHMTDPHAGRDGTRRQICFPSG
jgi:hypothetical protein